jgi:Tat protein translocase TatB subunit
MFGSLGFPELLLIFIVALIVFGPKRLPEVGRTLGKALGEFKKVTDDLKNTIEREVRVDELRQLTPANLMRPAETVVSRGEPSGPPEEFSMLPETAAPSTEIVTESTILPDAVSPADPATGPVKTEA